ncbi:hypothetical protein JW868_03305, partial [Candidatus Woesearchaeota archaeon]|nr:hypothetical protein [Candidatus Woesearchaeota archaeon]
QFLELYPTIAKGFQRYYDKDMHWYDWFVNFYLQLQDAYHEAPEMASSILAAAREEVVEIPIFIRNKINNAYFTRLALHTLQHEQIARALDDFEPADMIQHPNRMRRRLREVVDLTIN